MKKLVLSLIFSITLFQAFSQKVYFIYIQSELEQPFNVRMNDRTYKSTSSGYIILSNLRDTTHNFGIGISNLPTEQNFSVAMNTKDHGYLLKNFGDKGWGLFDLQTLSIQMAKKEATKKETVVIKDEISKFTEILAKAVDDSSLLQKPLPPKTEEKKIENVSLPIEKKEEQKAVIQVSQPMKEEAKEVKPGETKQVIPEAIKEKKETENTTLQKDSTKIAAYQKSIVTLRSESFTPEGFGMTFIDQYENGNIDTVNILIPDLKALINETKAQPAEEKKFLDITNADSEISKSDTSLIIKNNENKTEKIVLKNNCSSVANETDFLELRRKMATAMNDDDMRAEASKFYKTKCFYTGQIKNLSVLFLNDEGKYRFFDASYKYVADIENFASLQGEMKDEYYINRFRAMLK